MKLDCKLLFLATIVLLFSCKKKENLFIQKTYSNKILVLKIDYMTNQLEGAKELSFQDSDDFTISHESKSPGDFGWIKLYYKEFNQLIFEGSIIWNGTGELIYPKPLINVNQLDTIVTSLPFPGDSIFEKNDTAGYFNPDSVSFSTIWSSISNLKLVSDYRMCNPTGKIHVFSYTPNIGFLPIMKERMEFYVFIKN